MRVRYDKSPMKVGGRRPEYLLQRPFYRSLLLKVVKIKEKDNPSSFISVHLGIFLDSLGTFCAKMSQSVDVVSVQPSCFKLIEKFNSGHTRRFRKTFMLWSF